MKNDRSLYLVMNHTQEFELNASVHLSEPSTLPFQVSTNGALSFSERLQRYSGEGLSMANTALIAPFWADVDTREIGEVFYRQTNESSCIANVTSIIHEVFEDAVEFTPFTVFIATWNNVGYSKRNTDRVSRNVVYYCSYINVIGTRLTEESYLKAFHLCKFYTS